MTSLIEQHAPSLLDGSQHLETPQLQRTCKILAKNDYIYVTGDKTRDLIQETGVSLLDDWQQFAFSWNDLEIDQYMGDGGRYRKRRHATLSALPSSRNFYVRPHQPHFQSLTYNNLNGGIARHFAPIEPKILTGTTMSALIQLGCSLFGRIAPYYPWHIEVHQFRIEAASNQPGKPTPEGIHRDGVNYVMMFMIARHNLVNGSTAIYDLDKTRLDEFTLQHPLDLAITNDERIFHSVTPIVQLDTAQVATRDVLVITFRKKF
jgi:hypothetical protein